MTKLIYTSISEQGKRNRNEDSYSILDVQQENCWMGIVCDGMGGHTHGEVASRLVVDAITTYWNDHLKEPDTPEKVIKACKKASHQFDKKVYEIGHTQMGTTMVMACLQGNHLTIAHLGDSRCYFFDSLLHIKYVTKDHITHKDGFERITKCFFSYHPEVATPEISEFEVKPGDLVLLCSDGIYKSMSDSTLFRILKEAVSTKDALDKIDYMCEDLSRDNYTAILLQVVAE